MVVLTTISKTIYQRYHNVAQFWHGGWLELWHSQAIGAVTNAQNYTRDSRILYTHCVNRTGVMEWKLEQSCPCYLSHLFW